MEKNSLIVKDQSLDVVRCLMNYMIVLLHAWAAFQYVPWGCGEFVVWSVVCNHLMWMAVPTFFLISGYLLFQKFSLASWPNKMMRRVKRLVVPYLAWNVFFVVFYLGLAHFVPRLGARVAAFGLDTFSGAFSKVVSLTIAPIDGPLWFVRVLFLMALISPILWGLMRFGRGVLLLGAALVWCVAESLLGLREVLSLTLPAYAIVCFTCGGLLAKNGKDLVGCFRSWGWLVVGLAACLVRVAIALPRLCADQAQTTGEGLALSLLAALEAPALISMVSRLPIKRITANRTYGFLKEMSFFAYAGHFLFCSMCLHVAAPLLSGVRFGKMTLLVLIFVGFGLLLMAAFFCLGRKVCPRVLKVFDGTL